MEENEEKDQLEAEKEKEGDVFYENSGIFRVQSDPFGKEFEQSLNDAPALPVRNRYSRQNSRSSNASSKKSSYDEMSIHAGRPVIVTDASKNNNDPLSDVSFESPLKDLDQHRVQRSLPVPVPVPAPRLSKMKVQERRDDVNSEESAYVNENNAIYEELVPKVFPTDPSRSPEVLISAPDAPPRFELDSAAQQAEECHDEESGGDNIYTELKPPALSSSKRCLLEEEDEPSEAISPTLSTQLSEDVGQVRAKLTTIDIRKDVNRLWDMAVQELHRDQTLIEYLEKRESGSEAAVQSSEDATSAAHAKKLSVNSYDSVAIPDQRFKIVDGVQVPIPVKILADFDPCFDKTDDDNDELSEVENEEAKHEDTVSGSAAVTEDVVTNTSDSSPDLRAMSPNEETMHRDSTTSASSADIPMPAQPPPPPPPPPKQLKSESEEPCKQLPPRPYENVWIPEEGKCQLESAVSTPPTPKKSPAPCKPKRLSKQISTSFKMERTHSAGACATSNLYEAPAEARALEKADSVFVPLSGDDGDDCSTRSFSKESSASTESAKDVQPQLQVRQT